MDGFFPLARRYLVFQAGLVALYVVSGFNSSRFALRVSLGIAIALGVAAILTSLALLGAVAARKAWRRASALPFVLRALLIAVGWGFGIAGWAEEFAANDELPIINIGIFLVPLGLILGIPAAVSPPERPSAEKG